MLSSIARTSQQWSLLPRRAHALDGAGRQTTARRHSSLPPAGSLRLVLMAQASTPSCLPLQALCSAVRATHPVQSTGKGRRAESRSVSDPGPGSLAAEPCPRRDRPVPSAGPGATIRHRVLSGKSSFLLFPNRIVVPYVPSDANLADFFTKPLRPSKFFPLRDKIMNVGPPQS